MRFAADTLVALALLSRAALVSAIFFNSPTASTVWPTSAGQTLAWTINPQGGAAATTATFLIKNAEGTSSATLASSYTLTTLSLAFPANVVISSPSNKYIVYMVSNDDLSFIYTQVGPFQIDAFESTGAGSASSAVAPISAAPTTAVIVAASTTVIIESLSTSTSLSTSYSTSYSTFESTIGLSTTTTRPSATVANAAPIATTTRPAGSIKNVVSLKLVASISLLTAMTGVFAM